MTISTTHVGSLPRSKKLSELLFKKYNEIYDKASFDNIVSTSNFVEHPNLICKRLMKFVDIIGKDIVISWSDSGLGTFAGYGNVDEDIVFVKFKSMTEAAKRF